MKSHTWPLFGFGEKSAYKSIWRDLEESEENEDKKRNELVKLKIVAKDMVDTAESVADELNAETKTLEQNELEDFAGKEEK